MPWRQVTVIKMIYLLPHIILVMDILVHVYRGILFSHKSRELVPPSSTLAVGSNAANVSSSKEKIRWTRQDPVLMLLRYRVLTFRCSLWSCHYAGWLPGSGSPPKRHLPPADLLGERGGQLITAEPLIIVSDIRGGGGGGGGGLGGGGGAAKASGWIRGGTYSLIYFTEHNWVEPVQLFFEMTLEEKSSWAHWAQVTPTWTLQTLAVSLRILTFLLFAGCHQGFSRNLCDTFVLSPLATSWLYAFWGLYIEVNQFSTHMSNARERMPYIFLIYWSSDTRWAQDMKVHQRIPPRLSDCGNIWGICNG